MLRDILSLDYLYSWLSFAALIGKVLKFISLFSFNQKASLCALGMLHDANQNMVNGDDHEIYFKNWLLFQSSSDTH